MSGLTQQQLRAPFPWYGGKRRIAGEVWQLLGTPGRYIEPFAGSLGVLLGRPGGAPKKGLEVVNDLDGYIVNAWRAIKSSPSETAAHAVDLVSETDVTARHLYLVNEAKQDLRRLAADPEWHDPKIAGWWLYGIAAWIGSGWCSGQGPWTKKTILTDRQLPHLGNDGRGVNRQLPHLGDDGQGVKAQAVEAYMHRLARRLQNVIVCNGDWHRTLTPSATASRTFTSVGVFLDPPYRQHGSEYATGNSGVEDVWQRIETWCHENADNPKYRVIVCGYEGDFNAPESWREIAYTATGTQSENATRERMWASPACLGQQSLLEEIGGES